MGKILECGAFSAEPFGMDVMMGTIDDRSFVAGYRRDGALAGVMALNSIKPFVQYRRLLLAHASWDEALAKAAELNDS